MPSKKIMVLVVDDDIRIRRMMQHMLEMEGYAVLTVGSGNDALEVLERENPELVLLDIMMPGMDGIVVCQRIREFSSVPIILVTAKGDEAEKVRGLDNGADDYVTKPFSVDELLARVRAVMRRQTAVEKLVEPEFSSEGLLVDFVRRRVTVNGEEVNLTPTEYKLLSYLARNADCVLTPDQILEKVWGEEYAGETRLLQVNMARLRQKLGDKVKNPRYIITRPGIGYMMPREKCHPSAEP